MANQVSVILRVEVRNGDLVDQFVPAAATYEQTTQGLHSTIQVVGTTAEAFSVGDVTTPGVLCIQNLDATHFVTFGPDSAGTMIPVGKLLPGRVAMFPMAPSITFKLQADTASCRVKLWLLEV